MNFHQDNWADLLALTEFAYNNVQHASTHMSPFLATYRFHQCLFPLTPADSLVPAAADFLQELTAAHQVLQEQLDQAKEDFKKFADQH